MACRIEGKTLPEKSDLILDQYLPNQRIQLYPIPNDWLCFAMEANSMGSTLGRMSRMRQYKVHPVCMHGARQPLVIVPARCDHKYLAQTCEPRTHNLCQLTPSYLSIDLTTCLSSQIWPGPHRQHMCSAQGNLRWQCCFMGNQWHPIHCLQRHPKMLNMYIFVATSLPLGRKHYLMSVQRQTAADREMRVGSRSLYFCR